VIKLTYQLATI